MIAPSFESEAEPLGLSLLVPRADVPEALANAHALKSCVSVARDAARLLAQAPKADPAGRVARLDAALGQIAELVEGAARPKRPRPSQDVRVEEVVHAVCWTLRDRGEAAKVAVFVAATRGIVHGDSDALYHALFNLVLNAIEATEPGGAVFVDAGVTREGDHLWTVRDTGCGIPADTLAALADPRPWTQADMGLGVALAVNVVHRHGGLLRFDTRRGSGTCVTIWLPSTEARRAIEHEADACADAEIDQNDKIDGKIAPKSQRETLPSVDVGPI